MTNAMNVPKYIHLKTHSAYSLLEGALPIAKIAKLAEKAGMPAIGLTRHQQPVRRARVFRKALGRGHPAHRRRHATRSTSAMRPRPRTLSCARARMSPPCASPGQSRLIASNADGYANLIKLASQAFLLPDPTEPTHIKIEALEAHREA